MSWKFRVAPLIASAIASSASGTPLGDRWLIDIRMTATVVSTPGQLDIHDAEGNYVRTIDYRDLPRAPWEVGDSLVLRWRHLHSQPMPCTRIFFGGIDASHVDQDSPCFLGRADDAFVRNSGGVNRRLSDGFIGGPSFGPTIDLQTGEVTLRYGSEAVWYFEDGSKVCCGYVYNEALDELEHFLTNAHDDLDGFLTGFNTFYMPSSPAIRGTRVPINFRVSWDATLHQVPEPGALLLIGLSVLGLAARRKA